MVFLVLVCYATTQLALQLQQESIQVVPGIKVCHSIPNESNSTPTMDFGLGTDHVRRYHGMCV